MDAIPRFPLREATQRVQEARARAGRSDERTRISNGSTPVAAAISSRKLSLPNVFCMRPGARIHAAGNGVSTSQCAVSLLFGSEYGMPSPMLCSARCGRPELRQVRRAWPRAAWRPSAASAARA